MTPFRSMVRPRAAALAVALLTAACGSGSTGSSDLAETDAPTPSAARSVEDAPTSTVAPGVDVESMVLAAVLIESGGDVDRAISDGTINEADAAAARVGLADGSLDALFD